MNRRIFALLGAAAMLTGCKEPQAQGSGSGNQFVNAGDNVVVKSVKVYASTQNSVQGDTYYVVTFTFTNTFGGETFTPRLTHFVLEDAQKTRHAAIDGGTYLSADINNDFSPMKKGESRDFTTVFNVYQNTTGTLFYDPT